MAENLGLFGWPLPEPRDRAGRPEHAATEENRIKIKLLLVFGKSNAEIASAIGLSVPTLRKHYLPELEQRKVARLQLDAIRFSALYAKMLTGDVGAMKELGKLLDKRDLAELSDKVNQRGGRRQAEPKMGKKETLQKAAGEVAGKFAPPAPPSLIN